MGDALVAIGGALVVAGLLGRGGRRIGLPTIPLFMLARSAPRPLRFHGSHGVWRSLVSAQRSGR